MQTQQLMLAMEDFYQSCYPKQTAALAVNNGAATGVVNTSTASGNNPVVRTTGSSGNLILKLMLIGGLIYLVYHLVNNYSKANKKDENNKHF